MQSTETNQSYFLEISISLNIKWGGSYSLKYKGCPTLKSTESLALLLLKLDKKVLLI